MNQHVNDVIRSIVQKIQSIPQQLRVLLVGLIVFLFVFTFVRRLFIPETFGKYGHYRAAAVDSIAALNIVHAGHQACAECHDDVAEEKSKYLHRHVACETCHGPGYAHTQEPDEHELPAPRDRSYCILCHAYNPSRPTGFPQIDPVVHNPQKACMTCHQPHTPEPPHTPEECSACHAGIARTMAVSPHQILPCTRCHEAKEQHKTTPRAFLPTIPHTSKFCGECHARGADSPSDIPRIDLLTHGEGYFCGQCHYPHYPEVY